MNQKIQHNFGLKNVNSPFTEIFSILIKYQVQQDNTLALAYSQRELKIINSHLDNAVEMLLQGLQEVGQLIAVADKTKLDEGAFDSLGHFLNVSCNLVEALYKLKNDVEP